MIANFCHKINKFKWQNIILQEISLGILGNLACHEALMNQFTTTNTLLETLVDQVFSNDALCLCEVFRYVEIINSSSPVLLCCNVALLHRNNLCRCLCNRASSTIFHLQFKAYIMYCILLLVSHEIRDPSAKMW